LYVNGGKKHGRRLNGEHDPFDALATRLSDFARNRHESCGLVGSLVPAEEITRAFPVAISLLV
jgi:hypothetical protein